jgi:uncharacterized phage protein gp47/JayE
MVLVAPPRFEDLLADQITYFSSQSARATDFNPGSVTRTILEIIAQIQERRDVAAWSTLNRAIDEAVFDAWGFAKKEAQAATGQVTLFRAIGDATPFTIRKGDIFRVPESTINVYEAISPAFNPDGSDAWVSHDSSTWVTRDDGAVNYVTLNVACVTPGVVGNIGTGLITQADFPLPGIVQILNFKPLTNGKDVSSDAERRAEFAAYIQALPRGTIESIKFGAKTTVLLDNFGAVVERVRKVNVVEYPTTPVPAPGTIRVYVNSGSPATTPALISQCQAVIDGYIDSQGVRQDGWRAAGITAEVRESLYQNVSMRLDITVATGYQLENVVTLVKQAIQNLFHALDVGDRLVRSDLLMYIKLVPGVLDAEIYTFGTTVNNPANLFTPPAAVPTTLLVLNQIEGQATLGARTIQIAYP